MLDKLPKNIGKQDRNIRFAIGGLLVLLALLGRNALGGGFSTILVIIGLIVLATAYIGTCLAYIPLQMDTRKDDEK